jgi:hypothetical protein
MLKILAFSNENEKYFRRCFRRDIIIKLGAY